MTSADVLTFVVSVVAGALGGGTMGRLLSDTWGASWKGGIEAQLRQLQGTVERGTFVRQRFVDFELEAITACWRAARACLPLINATRPHDSSTVVAELVERTNQLSDAHNVLVAELGRHELFLSDAMRHTLDELRQTVALELMDIRVNEPFVGNWWERGEEQQKKFKTLCDTLLVLARTRKTELYEETEVLQTAAR